jgi:16S rRNA C967 or C1407 C5-methylase (RsmB/RsmF family)
VQLLRAIATPPPFTSIRVNTLRITREELINKLHEEWGT